MVISWFTNPMNYTYLGIINICFAVRMPWPWHIMAITVYPSLCCISVTQWICLREHLNRNHRFSHVFLSLNQSIESQIHRVPPMGWSSPRFFGAAFLPWSCSGSPKASGPDPRQSNAMQRYCREMYIYICKCTFLYSIYICVYDYIISYMYK